jgi:hypothetical protein
MTMFNALKRFFCGPTPEEQYLTGRRTADTLLTEGQAEGHPLDCVAEHIYAMGFGAFNDTAADRAFDRGIQDRLSELGYESPN